MSAQCEMTLLLRLDAWANARMNPYAANGVKKEQKRHTRLEWLGLGKPIPSFPCEVIATRYGKGLLDDDNLPSAFKYVRDELTECFGLKSDAGPEVRWVYQQEKASYYRAKLLIVADGITSVTHGGARR